MDGQDGRCVPTLNSYRQMLEQVTGDFGSLDANATRFLSSLRKAIDLGPMAPVFASGCMRVHACLFHCFVW